MAINFDKQNVDSVTKPVLAMAEKAIAAALQLDPETRDGVAQMSSKVIAIDLQGLDCTVYLLPGEQGIRLTTEVDQEVDVRLQGTPLALARMALDRERVRAALSGDVKISGDLALSQHLQSVISRMDIDWEELLAGYVGDVAAHHFGNLCRGVLGWSQHVRRTLEADVAEYLLSEIRLVPQHREIDAFGDAVDNLRLDTDRLEQRLKRLRSLV